MVFSHQRRHLFHKIYYGSKLNVPSNLKLAAKGAKEFETFTSGQHPLLPVNLPPLDELLCCRLKIFKHITVWCLV